MSEDPCEIKKTAEGYQMERSPPVLALDCHVGVLDKGLCEIETTVGGRKMEQSRPTLDLGLPHRRGPCNIENAIVGYVMECSWPRAGPGPSH